MWAERKGQTLEHRDEVGIVVVRLRVQRFREQILLQIVLFSGGFGLIQSRRCRRSTRPRAMALAGGGIVSHEVATTMRGMVDIAGGGSPVLAAARPEHACHHVNR
jgi:hypothetical protein